MSDPNPTSALEMEVTEGEIAVCHFVQPPHLVITMLETWVIDQWLEKLPSLTPEDVEAFVKLRPDQSSG